MRLLCGDAIGASRAHSSLLADRTASPVLPVGTQLIVAPDGSGGTPYVCRITSVAIKRFGEVDASDAWLEGIGDRSLESWVRQRSAAFALRAQELGIVFDERTEIVIERFAFVRPARPDEAERLFEETAKFSG